MKLLMQSDDYGITPAVARGIVDGIEKGILRNTGMFMNMPWAETCADWIKPCLNEIALGVDLNLTTGAPLSAPSDLPSLVNAQGRFYTSWESRRMDSEQNRDHARIDEVRRELNAQIQKYIELFGKKPDYLHSHAYETEAILQVHHELAKQYDVPYCSDIMKTLTGKTIQEYRIGWYKKPATLENQAASSLKDYILEHSAELLSQEYCLLIGHMGYVDKALMELSTYSLYRLNDLDAVVSPEMIDWINTNKVELITYKDLAGLHKK
ncbi:ChbG/HpnK family deacetylase [Holdemania filiformis]|uniref:ChbG/HpnK family deacetylase n=1 Tax=Holdemania filiformis TaxID=61171 RepID=A0A412G5I1_9FIRM|nr:ChbG/HpnK family deacetylase [Holdemania filiformis]MBS5000273.1 ChbG/HpnK family deacetylase [Holdemania filiformis]RGR75942.1 ChbG/HpnK family deacetylase [Holdemania filiformis]